MIKLSTFLANIQKIADARPTYKLGTDGTPEPTCDCIGLIIGAFRRAGVEEIKNHGSNWSARYEMATLESPVPVELGGLVFKYRDPGETGYALPDTYEKHPDRRDYYHVGVITSVSPLRITHCSSSPNDGINIDTALNTQRKNGWRYGGRIDGVDYDSREDLTSIHEKEFATVTALSGKSVRMRVSPSIQSIAKANVPIGAEVEVLQKTGGWWEILYSGKAGWMLASFLDGNATADDEPEPLLLKIDVIIDLLVIHRASIDRTLEELMDARELTL